MKNKPVLMFYGGINAKNRGCEALSVSLINLLRDAGFGSKILVYGILRGDYNKDINNIEYRKFPKLSSPRSIWQFIKEIKKYNTVIDLGYGDGFSDIYGKRRMRSQIIIKLAAIFFVKKLILAPQTIGPFNHRFSKFFGRMILKRSSVIYARDIISAFYAHSVAPNKFRSTIPDMAFYLKPIQPTSLPDFLTDYKTDDIIGVNISGLLWISGYTRNNQFGLSVSYQDLCIDLVKTFLSKGKKILLIPHSYSLNENFIEDDLSASVELLKEFGQEHNKRLIYLIQEELSSQEIKWIISRMSFFIGARMHACISAISSNIPTVALSYSRKFEGLFSTIGLNSLVLNLRDANSISPVERVLQLYESKDEIAHVISYNLKEIRNHLRLFSNDLVDEII